MESQAGRIEATENKKTTENKRETPARGVSTAGMELVETPLAGVFFVSPKASRISPRQKQKTGRTNWFVPKRPTNLNPGSLSACGCGLGGAVCAAPSPRFDGYARG